MKKNEDAKIVNQWIGINNEMKLYKVLMMVLVVSVLVLSILLAFSFNQDPIVIKVEGERREFFLGEKQSIEPNANDIKSFLLDFISLRYSIDGKNLSLTLRNIAPWTTTSYMEILKGEFSKEFADEKQWIDFYQTVANVSVILLKDNSFGAKFDKIIRLKGIPLIVPTEITFTLLRTRPHKWNPKGILVNGVVEHEDK